MKLLKVESETERILGKYVVVSNMHNAGAINSHGHGNCNIPTSMFEAC